MRDGLPIGRMSDNCKLDLAIRFGELTMRDCIASQLFVAMNKQNDVSVVESFLQGIIFYLKGSSFTFCNRVSLIHAWNVSCSPSGSSEHGTVESKLCDGNNVRESKLNSV